MNENRIVIGSGPSAVGVTLGLLERGYRVIMLDVGETLDAETAGTVSRMAQQAPSEWSGRDKQIIQRVDFNTDPALAPKRQFGSTYAYYLDPKIEAPRAMRLYGSHAFGGLSVLWGCALLRTSHTDRSDWDAEVSSGIDAAYSQIRDLLRTSIGADIFAEGTHLRIAEGARAIWNRYRATPALQEQLKLYPTPLTIATACKACNACMYGCVYGYTYSARTSIEDVFLRNPRFRYVGGMAVESVSETTAGVEIRATNLKTGQRETIPGQQVFLAAGMMGSLRILWNSIPGMSRALEARDSTTFLIPGLIFSGQWRGPSSHHGLSHLSVDLAGGPFVSKPAHAQIYFNNPAVADGLKARLGPLNLGPMRKLIDLANRFVVAGQGYLHSDFCHRLKLECSDAGVIRASVIENPASSEYAQAALSQLVRAMRQLGAYFIKPAVSITPHGGSKTAGALPHARVAEPTTTDVLGRPLGAKNVFVVDATVIPSIPARNVTLTMMANALRIGQSA
jgi:choline dehydrogenase-like flavoprotein